MTRENAKDFLPLVKALADGKTIQMKALEGRWVEMPVVSFGGDPEAYRVKPEPREIWLNEFAPGHFGHCIFKSESAAAAHANFDKSARQIKFVEVLEDEQ